MNLSHGIFVLAVLVIVITDFLPSIKQKQRMGMALIGMLILTATGLKLCKLFGWPTPIQLLHGWLSPIGRMIWKD